MMVQRWFQDQVDPYLPNRHIDLVDFGDLHLFMFQRDNLYERSVPSERKGREIRAVQERNAHSGFPPAPIDRETVRTTDDPRDVFCIIADVIVRTDGSVTVLDVGAHVGAFGLKLASFLRTAGLPGRVVCFEPGTAGELLPHNVVLNGLTDWVHVEPLAVSDVTGLDVLHITPGNTDSDSLLEDGRRSYERIVATVRLDDYVKEHVPSGGLIIKLDTEGLEPRLIASMAKLRASRRVITVFEFMPWRYADGLFGLDLLGSLEGECLLFDVYYAPRVSRVELIEPADFATFISRVRERPYGYTDVLAIPRRLPGTPELLQRIADLRRSDGVLTL
jgi:FkbM family methyltransferase